MTEPVKYATLDDIKKATEAPRRFKDVTLPVSGLTVKIQSITEGEKSRFESDSLNRNGDTSPAKIRDARRRLIQACVAEPRIERHHIELLGGMDGADLGHLHNEIAAHVGWSEDDIAKMEKN